VTDISYYWQKIYWTFGNLSDSSDAAERSHMTSPDLQERVQVKHKNKELLITPKDLLRGKQKVI
jgi:hypothetical protein